MNFRRSKSVKLISSNSQSIEVELSTSLQMSSSVDNTVYCCIAKGNKILYSYNSKDHELEKLAVLSLENAPQFHAWYFHTVGTKTFGFLIVDGYTFFAIVDPSLGNLAILQFLEHLRDGFRKVSKNDFHEELVPIIKRLIMSLEKMPQASPTLMNENSGAPLSFDGSTSPLLGRSSFKHHDKKKMKEKVAEDDHDNRAVKISMPSEPVGAMSLQMSLSSGILQAQQAARRLWWRHVKIIIVADVIFCLVLFGVWLAVCRGFSCVSKK